MRLIDADNLNARLSSNGTPYYTVPDIENAPTVNAVPVVHGRWIEGKYDSETGDYMEKCSHCGVFSREYWKSYCSECGAKMD